MSKFKLNKLERAELRQAHRIAKAQRREEKISGQGESIEQKRAKK